LSKNIDGIEFRELEIADKEAINYYLHSQRHELSVYAFENIYIWKALYEVSWAIIEGALCVFFKDNIGSFLYLPPLNSDKEHKVVEKVFFVLQKLNSRSAVSRIENVEEKDISFYRELGYEVKYKSCDYLCQRQELAALAGNKFKSQRASCNHFIKHNRYEVGKYSPQDYQACLALYERWKDQRKAVSSEQLYQGMLEDNYLCLRVLLENCLRLDLESKIIKIGDLIKAFSFAFRLNQDTFCILYEVADLEYKGIAQFIFREFCRDLTGCQYINIMDDSGLENLKAVKLSYHPVKLIPAYIVTKQG